MKENRGSTGRIGDVRDGSKPKDTNAIPKAHMHDREAHLGAQLVAGLKQLQMNINRLHEVHVAKNLDIDAPYTKNTEDMLKVEFVNEALKGLERNI